MMRTRSKSRYRKRLTKTVDFEFYAPQAEEVQVAGTFNQWDASRSPLKGQKKGTWKLSLRLGPGRYEYRYLVDGVWQNDQRPVECKPNAFGTWNCVVEVQ